MSGDRLKILHAAGTAAAANGASANADTNTKHTIQVKVAAAGAFSVSFSPKHSLDDAAADAGSLFEGGAQVLAGTGNTIQSYTMDIVTNWISCPITAISGCTVEIVYAGTR